MNKRDDLFKFFSKISNRFDQRYNISKFSKERIQIWTHLLNKYSKNKFTALDMGCGNGIFSFLLAKLGLNTVGIDAVDEMIKLCEKHKLKTNLKNINFKQADITHAKELKLDKVDILICSSVLEYVDNIEDTLESFCNLVKDNGFLIVSLPNENSLYRKCERLFFKLFGKPEYYKHVKCVTSLNYLNKAVSTYNMKLLESRYYAHNSLVLGLSIIFRFSPKFSGNLFVAVFQK